MVPLRRAREVVTERKPPFARAGGLFCAALLALWIALSRPLAEMAMNDDWSYAWSAEVLARTGHVVYNGWATAMLSWQLYWGALFIRLFGFSFLTLRVSMLWLAMLTVVLMHALLRRCGVCAWHAMVGTLTLAVSPLFFPLVFSFMSDVPGLLAVLCCFYAAVRAVQARGMRAAFLWLAAAGVSNAVLGSVRQIAWLGVLVVVPCAAWLLRRHGRGFLVAAAALWMSCASVIALGMRWFARQPFILREPLLPVTLDAHLVSHGVSALLRVALTLVLYSLPVTLPLAAHVRLREGWVQLAFLGGSLLFLGPLVWATVRHLPNAWLAPFTYDSLGVPGFQDFVMLPGIRPAMLSNAVRGGLTALTGLVVVGLVLVLWRSGEAFRLERTSRSQAGAEGEQAGRGLSPVELLVLFGPYTAVYLGLYVTRSFQWDRYLLPVAFVFVLGLLRWYQDIGDEPVSLQGGVMGRLPVWTLAVVGVFAVVDVAANHDVFALYRARLAAAHALEEAGVARTRFSDGMEYDAWTELQQTGYVKDPRLVPPPGFAGYRADRPPPRACLNWFAPYTPSVVPVYSVTFTLPPCMQPTQFAEVPYRTWLPWRRQTLKIGRLKP